MNVRAAITFLLSVLLVFVCLLAVYVYFVDWAIFSNIRNNQLFDPKYIVAEHLKDYPKVLINSGSTGRYGVDSDVLQRELGVPVMNMAVNGNKSFDHLVQEIDRFSAPGDLVLLPLEWPYYSRQIEFNQNFISAISLGHYQNRYYLDADWPERLRYALSFPPNVLLRFGSWKDRRITVSHELNPRYVQTLGAAIDSWEAPADEHQERVYRGHLINGDRKYIEKMPPVNPKLMSCSKIFRNKFEIASTFKRGLRRLEKVARHKHLTVVFLPPATLSKSCPVLHTDWMQHNIDLYLERVRKQLAGHGFRLLGDQHVADFDIDYRGDINPFHLDADGRAIYTRTLLKLLRDAGIKAPQADRHQELAGLALPAMRQELLRLRQPLLETLEDWQGQSLDRLDPEFLKVFLFEAPLVDGVTDSKVMKIALWFRPAGNLDGKLQLSFKAMLAVDASLYRGEKLLTDLRLAQGESITLSFDLAATRLDPQHGARLGVSDTELHLLELQLHLRDTGWEDRPKGKQVLAADAPQDVKYLSFNLAEVSFQPAAGSPDSGEPETSSP